MASTYLTRTPTSNGSSTTWTYSVWVKRSADLGAYQRILSNGNQEGSGSQDTGIYFLTDDTIRFDIYFGDVGNVGKLDTNRKFRDTNGWYHFVFVWNTSSSTSSDRMKIYVNGVRETSFASATYPSQNASDPNTNSTSYPMRIGTRATSQYFNGLLSHAHFIDGTAYDATAFGEYDANGVWTIKTDVSVTYGTNGFFILKDGNSVTDQSGNGNNFTVGGGTLTDTLDCPDNVFATWNPLNYDFANNPSTFATGNTQVTPTQSTAYNTGVSTLAMPKGNGKFYTEIKYISSGNENGGFGIVDMDYVNNIYYENHNLMEEATATTIGRVLYAKTGAVVTGGGVETSGFGNTWSNGDIIGIACDMENGAIYFSKNGTWQNSGDPTSGVSRTGAVNTSAESWWTGTSQWGLWCGKKVNTTDVSFQANFGNGYFGTTAVASAGTNASGNGIFEYDVPTGYTALCTKGLNGE